MAEPDVWPWRAAYRGTLLPVTLSDLFVMSTTEAQLGYKKEMKGRQENANNGFLWQLGLQILQTLFYFIVQIFLVDCVVFI